MVDSPYGGKTYARKMFPRDNVTSFTDTDIIAVSCKLSADWYSLKVGTDGNATEKELLRVGYMPPGEVMYWATQYSLAFLNFDTVGTLFTQISELEFIRDSLDLTNFEEYISDTMTILANSAPPVGNGTYIVETPVTCLVIKPSQAAIVYTSLLMGIGCTVLGLTVQLMAWGRTAGITHVADLIKVAAWSEDIRRQSYGRCGTSTVLRGHLAYTHWGKLGHIELSQTLGTECKRVKDVLYGVVLQPWLVAAFKAQVGPAEFIDTGFHASDSKSMQLLTGQATTMTTIISGGPAAWAKLLGCKRKQAEHVLHRVVLLYKDQYKKSVIKCECVIVSGDTDTSDSDTTSEEEYSDMGATAVVREHTPNQDRRSTRPARDISPVGGFRPSQHYRTRCVPGPPKGRQKPVSPVTMPDCGTVAYQSETTSSVWAEAYLSADTYDKQQQGRKTGSSTLHRTQDVNQGDGSGTTITGR